jgi:hypothetical protein
MARICRGRRIMILRKGGESRKDHKNRKNKRRELQIWITSSRALLGYFCGLFSVKKRL